MTLPDDSEREDRDSDRNDGLPAYASERTHRLNWQGDAMAFHASLAADRREWEREEWGRDET